MALTEEDYTEIHGGVRSAIGKNGGWGFFLVFTDRQSARMEVVRVFFRLTERCACIQLTEVCVCCGYGGVRL